MSQLPELPQSVPPGSFYLLPTPRPWPGNNPRISILDSSFNPPTRAHLALASLPPPSTSTTAPDYTAHLLLFSLSNVDKTPKPTDPSLEQRIHLISLLIPYLPPNTAIGLINEATFVGKSSAIHRYLSNPASLTFIIGTDTLTRFFDPRYYKATDGGMDDALERFFSSENSRLVSARRGGKAEREVEESVVSRPEVARWVDEGRLFLSGEGTEKWVSMSSTKVRNAVKEGNWDEVSRLVVPEIAEYIREQGLYKAEDETS